jgi:hypothetical protein
VNLIYLAQVGNSGGILWIRQWMFWLYEMFWNIL